MLSPKRQFVLLPQDREIMAATGMTEEEYRWFVKETLRHCKIRPSDPVALSGFELILINLAISLLLTGVAYLLTPKPSQEKDKEVEQKNDVDGQDIVKRDRYTPKAGFDSVQQVVELGSVIPIVYAKREGQYGGIRVNTNMLWSQLLSVGGGQYAKTLHLISEGGEGFEIDPLQTAMGNNLLGSYELRYDAQAGRVTFYYNATGGRLGQDDYLIGVVPGNDPGAFRKSDVYKFEDKSTHFSMAVIPSNQTDFGVYSLIGNNFGYKLGESFEPQSYIDVAANEASRFDNQALADADKGGMNNSTRAGLISHNGQLKSGLIDLAYDDVVGYKIYSSSFQDEEIRVDRSSAGDQPTGVARMEDIASAIASRQRNYDELINIGDFYKIGSAIGVCISRSGDNFISEIEVGDPADAQDVEATFQIIEPGKVHLWDEAALSDPLPRRDNGVLATTHSHIFRIAVGSFTVERPTAAVELGIESQLGVKCSGITNFNSLVQRDTNEGNYNDTHNGDDYTVLDDSYQAFVNAEFTGGKEPNSDDNEEVAYQQKNLAGQYTASDERYSFFRIGYRTAEQDDFTYSTNLYGIRSQTGVSVYNFIRFEFDDKLRREFRILPISGWEIRSGEATGTLYIIDWHHQDYTKVEDFGVMLTFVGKEVRRTTEELGIKTFQINRREAVKQLGVVPPDDVEGFYVDAYARIAESFIYDQVDSTAGDVEHRISYVDVITENDDTPKYRNMALLGMNIRSSKEIRTLDQVSVYVTRGVIDSHLFPDVLYDLLTNDRYGTGKVFDPRQIDKDSFDECARWTDERGYYFDGAISDKRNLRSWGIEVAQNFLLDLSVASGVFSLKPSLNFTGPEPASALFTSGNIEEGSFAVSYFDVQDRLDPVVSVKWREERLNTGLNDRGLFPQIREVTVRRRGVSDNNPVTQIDLSNYCTNQRHAIDRAKMECQMRHYITHVVSFVTVPTEATIKPGSIIKVGMETVRYEQPQNGAITADGTITSWNALSDGSHQVLIWDGKFMKEDTLMVQGGKSISHGPAVFCLANSAAAANTYKVQSVTFNDEGNVEVEAIYWPTNDAGFSKLVEDWNDDNFVITGRIQ